MVQGIIERTPVTDGLKAMLNTYFVGGGTGGTNLLTEIGEAPRNLNLNANGQLVDPYGIIYPLPSQTIYAPGMFRGTLGLPDSGASLVYQITSVGRTDQSAQIFADRIRLGVLERGSNGNFVRTISAGPKMAVIHRTNREIGLAMASEGLWQVVDLYELEVQASV